MAKYRKQPTQEELQTKVEQDDQMTVSEEESLTGGDPKPKGVSDEEETFKKRYSDLRRHSQQKQNELSRDIEALKAQLQEYKNVSHTSPPEDEAKLKEWIERYPVVADVIEKIASSKVEEFKQSQQGQQKEIQDRMQEIALSEAKAAIAQEHPDFYSEIVGSDDFNHWLEYEAPEDMKKALVDPGPKPDVRKASAAIKLFKFDSDWKSRKSSSDRAPTKDSANKNTDEKGAASAVKGKGGPSNKVGSSETYLFSESQVRDMPQHEYEKKLDDIEKAIGDGKFLFDLSQKKKA